MIITIITGLVKEKPIYRKFNKGKDNERMECCFFVETYEPNCDETISVPVKAIGQCADYCYANINVGTTVELSGSFYCKFKKDGSIKEFYFIARDGTFKQPKARTQLQMTSSEFIEMYSPTAVLKRVALASIKENIKKK